MEIKYENYSIITIYCVPIARDFAETTVAPLTRLHDKCLKPTLSRKRLNILSSNPAKTGEWPWKSSSRISDVLDGRIALKTR